MAQKPVFPGASSDGTQSPGEGNQAAIIATRTSAPADVAKTAPRKPGQLKRIEISPSGLHGQDLDEDLAPFRRKPFLTIGLRSRERPAAPGQACREVPFFRLMFSLCNSTVFRLTLRHSFHGVRGKKGIARTISLYILCHRGTPCFMRLTGICPTFQIRKSASSPSPAQCRESLCDRSKLSDFPTIFPFLSRYAPPRACNRCAGARSFLAESPAWRKRRPEFRGQDDFWGSGCRPAHGTTIGIARTA